MMEGESQKREKKNSDSQPKQVYELENSFIKIRGWVLILTALGLGIFSLLNIASASFFISMKFYSKAFVFVKKQFLFLLLGLIPLIVGMKLNYEIYKQKKIIKLIIITTFILFGIIAVGTIFKLNYIVPLINGSRRWINLRFMMIQPSEVLKIAYIILIAKGLQACHKKKYKNLEIIIIISPVILFFVLLVFFEKDLGTALHYIAISFIMIFFANINLKYIFNCIIIILIIGLSYASFAYFLGSDKSYRNRRIKAYVNGVIYDEYDNGDGYQIKQSLIAIGSGGLLGKGLGRGTQKYNYLPEIHTDFILASIGEEWGFIGVSIVLLAYMTILQIGITIAKSTKDYFGKYLAIGITGFMFTQVIMNTFVVTGLMPVTGIPLSLMSYGGTSLWTVLFSIGILYNINHQLNSKNSEIVENFNN